MADDGFKLPGASYEELGKIIKAYAAQQGETSAPQVAQLLGTDPTFVSRNNAFLLETGLLDEVKGRKKVPTDLGRELGRALEYDMADDIRQAWRRVVDGTEFLSRLVSAVRIRKGMEPSNLQSHIAYSAGQRKSSPVMTGARTVIAVLEEAGVLKLDDGKYVVSDAQPTEAGPDTPQRPAPRTTPEARFVDTWFELNSPSAPPRPGRPEVVLNLQVQLQVGPADLEGLAPRIVRFMRDLENREPPTEPQAEEGEQPEQVE